MPESILPFLLRQSLDALPLIALVAICDYFWRSRAAGVLQVLWSLVLIKLIFPGQWLGQWFGIKTQSLLPVPLPIISDDLFYAMGNHSTLAAGPALPITWPVIVWLAGLVIISSGFVIRYIQVKRLVGESTVDVPASLNRRLLIWRRRLGIGRRVQIQISERSASAFYYSLLRPVIVLPQNYKQLSLNALDAVIGHECIHIRRFDNQRLFLYGLVRTVFWFNPLVWWAVLRLRLFAEQIADQHVVRKAGLPAIIYGRWLIAVSSKRPGPLAEFSTFSMQKSFLRLRIQSLVRRKPVNRLLVLILLGSALVLSAYLPASLKVQNTTQTAVRVFTTPIHSGRLTSAFVMRSHPIKTQRRIHTGFQSAAHT